MRGKRWKRKRAMRRRGFRVLREGPVENDRRTYSLALRAPDGREVVVRAPTRPRAYLYADELTRRAVRSA